jgi:regulation of enolase protein 1 (concanavalin A-like superfamily)
MTSQLRTLQQIFDMPDKDKNPQSTMGIIVDSTAPYKKDVKKDFILKIKVVDAERINEPCSVFIYSKDIDKLKCSLELGDILLLRMYLLI